MAPKLTKPTVHINFAESEIFCERFTSIIAVTRKTKKKIIPISKKMFGKNGVCVNLRIAPIIENTSDTT